MEVLFSLKSIYFGHLEDRPQEHHPVHRVLRLGRREALHRDGVCQLGDLGRRQEVDQGRVVHLEIYFSNRSSPELPAHADTGPGASQRPQAGQRAVHGGLERGKGLQRGGLENRGLRGSQAPQHERPGQFLLGNPRWFSNVPGPRGL